MKVLEAKNINKYFHKPVTNQVLQNISLDINQGEFVSIMGKSGCGKSTLLYILSTMDTDYTGELFLNNQLITGANANTLANIRNESIGFVFQFHYLLPEFTVLENVMLPAKKLGRLPDELIRDNAINKLQLLGIDKHLDKKAASLSGGEKQRVAIARALINDPKIIIGDEPTGNLDSKNAENVFEIFKHLSITEKLSILVVTHDDDFAKNTDRTIHMLDGKII